MFNANPYLHIRLTPECRRNVDTARTYLKSQGLDMTRPQVIAYAVKKFLDGATLGK